MVGDIQMNSEQFQSMNTVESGGTFQAGVSLPIHRWPLNEMPVEIDHETIFMANRLIIERTISMLNRNFCGCFRIRFVIVIELSTYFVHTYLFVFTDINC